MSSNNVIFREIVTSFLESNVSRAPDELERLEKYLPQILDTGKVITVMTRNPETKEKETIEVEIPNLDEFIHGRAPIIDINNGIRYIIKDINPNTLNVLLLPTHTNSGSSVWISPEELKSRVADMLIYHDDVFTRDEKGAITTTPQYKKDNQSLLQMRSDDSKRPKVSYYRSGVPQTKYAPRNKIAGQYFARKVKNNV